MIPQRRTDPTASPVVRAFSNTGPGSLVETRFDAAGSTLWISMLAQDRKPHNFSNEMLSGLLEVLDQLQEQAPLSGLAGADDAAHYAVLRSGHAQYFSLGGDLGYFLRCIRTRDSAALRRYSMLCLDMIYRWATVLNRNTTTLSLVQGRALGGGFEAALAADYVIAEEHAEFGLPEILFGLFPCSGAMSLLGRRIGIAAAERLMRSGKVYSAAELLDMGVIDEVCASGRGEAAVREFIAQHARRRKARLAMQRARARMVPLDYAELATVVDEWVDAALQLDDEEIRVLETLVRMQRADFAH